MNSETKKHIVFIINPVSGTERKEYIVSAIHERFRLTNIHYDIVYTNAAGHASELAKKAIHEKYDAVVAVGGDGTVNEIAQVLIHSPVHLGIIPQGSGNGLARHLGIPMDTTRAIERLFTPKSMKIDAAKANGNYFFCTAGVGFDAHVSASFAARTRKGLSGYVFFALQEGFGYQPLTYTIEWNGNTLQTEAFLIAVANSTQYGNNAYIAPQADIQDGQLDLCIIKPFPTYHAPKLAWQIFNRTLPQNPHVEMLRASSFKISFDKAVPAHIDGESKALGTSIDYQVISRALNVWV